MDETVDPNHIAWNSNTGKRGADHTMFRAMAFDLLQAARVASPRGLRVLSFPGPTWLWEQGLADIFDPLEFEFTGIERDKAVWKKLARTAEALPGHFRMCGEPISFLDYTRQAKGVEPFNVVYLDWMGVWSEDKKADLDMLFDSDLLADGGLLAMTLSLGRGQMADPFDISHNLPMTFYDARGQDKHESGIKVGGIPGWVQSRAMECQGVGIRPLMASVYYSMPGLGSNHVQPQLQLMFLREDLS